MTWSNEQSMNFTFSKHRQELPPLLHCYITTRPIVNCWTITHVQLRKSNHNQFNWTAWFYTLTTVLYCISVPKKTNPENTQWGLRFDIVSCWKHTSTKWHRKMIWILQQMCPRWDRVCYILLCCLIFRQGVSNRPKLARQGCSSLMNFKNKKNYINTSCSGYIL